MVENDKPAGKITMARPVGRAGRVVRVTGYVFGVAMCVVFMAVGTVSGYLYGHSREFREILGKHGGQVFVSTIFHGDPFATWKPEVQFPGRTSLNVLVLGCDHDYDSRDQIIKTSPGRSDSILLARVDFAHKTIQALTIPRDTAVRIPGRRGIHKINAAHNFGGAELTMETIHSVFGVNPDCTVTVSLEGFQKIIDAVGGVDVTIKKNLNYDDNWGHLHIHLKPGFQHLNGYKAMGYVRMRHSDSDFMRSERQHEFLESLRERVKQPSAFLVLGSAIDKTFDALTLTGLNKDQLLALGNFARGLPKQNIALETLPSFEGPSYVSVDVEKSAEVIRRLFFPNQQYAMSIDAPDRSTVDAMNSRYGGRRGKHGRKHGKAAVKSTDDENAMPPDEGPDTGLGAPDAGNGGAGSGDSGNSSGGSGTSGSGSGGSSGSGADSGTGTGTGASPGAGGGAGGTGTATHG